LRVPESSEKLDNSDIHPDQYELAKYILNTPILNSFPSKEKEATEIFKQYEPELKKLYPDVNI